MTEGIKQPKTESQEDITEIKHELTIRKTQLKSLLEITGAINHNFSNDQLVNKFEKVIREACHLSHYILYYFNKKWTCILHQPGDKKTKELTDKILEHLVAEGSLQESFRSEWEGTYKVVTPVTHENHRIAYLFTAGYSDNKKERDEMVKFVETVTNLIVVAMENN